MPECWKDMTEDAYQKGHGGIDWLAYAAFVDALKNGTEMPVDVYDAVINKKTSSLEVF